MAFRIYAHEGKIMTNIWNEFTRKPSYEEKIKELLKDKSIDTTRDMDKNDFIAKWGANNNKSHRIIIE